jgi:hypothetical protein
MLNLLGVSQPDRDQTGGINWQAPALRDDRCVIFSSTNYSFDRPTIEEKPFEAEVAYFRLGEL